MRFAPFNRRSDERLRRWARIRSSAASETAYRPHRHVVIAQHLARQPDADRPLGGEYLSLRHGHASGLAGDELDPARRASSVAATRVQDVHLRVLFDRKHEALAILDINRSKSFDCQLRHVWFLLGG